jgi:hypothetical protein
MGSSTTEDAYCLKWNDFHTSITASFSDLRNESDLLDTVVVCEGQQVTRTKMMQNVFFIIFFQKYFLKKLPPYTLAEFDLTFHNSDDGDDATRPRRQRPVF